MTDDYVIGAKAENLAEEVSEPETNVLFQPVNMRDSKGKMTSINRGDTFKANALKTMALCFEVSLEKAYVAVKESEHASVKKARTDFARQQNKENLRKYKYRVLSRDQDSIPESKQEEDGFER
jgi:hypothetical protein